VLEPKFLHSLLKEHGFIQSPECSNEQCLQVMGTLLVAQRVLGGTLTKTERSYTIDLLMVDPLKRMVLQRVLYEFKNTDSKSLKEETHKVVEMMFSTKRLEIKSIPKVPNTTGRHFKTLVWVPLSAVITGGIGVIVGYFYYKLKHDSNSQPQTGANELQLDDAPVRTR
jgi:hypothetical protein